MDEQEHAVADQLLRAGSLQEVQTVLLRSAASCKVGALLAELRERAGRLRAAGRAAEAELTEHLTGVVERERIPEFERRFRSEGRPTTTGFPEPPGELRMWLEQDISRLLDAGDLDAGVTASHQADRVPLQDVGEWPRLTGLRVRLARALRAAGRPWEALAAVEHVGFNPSAAGEFSRSGLVYVTLAQLYLVRAYAYEDLKCPQAARAAFDEAYQAAQLAGDDVLQLQAQTGTASSNYAEGRHRDAVREFRRLLQFAESRDQPGFVASALNNLGIALRSAGEHAAARACHERVLVLAERRRALVECRVTAQFALGDLAFDQRDIHAAGLSYLHGFMDAVEVGAIASAQAMLTARLDRDMPESDLLLKLAAVFRNLPSRPRDREDWRVTAAFTRAEAWSHRRQGRQSEAVRLLRRLREEAATRGGGAWYQDLTTDLARTLAGSPEPTDRQEAFDLLWQERCRLREAPGDGPTVETASVLDHAPVYRLLVDLLTDPPGSRPLRLPDARPPIELAFDLHEELHERTAIRRGAPASFSALRGCLDGLAEAPECAYVSLFHGPERTTVFTYAPGADGPEVTHVPIGSEQLARISGQLQRTFDGDPRTFPPLAPLHPRRPWRRSLDFLGELMPLVAAFLPRVAGRPLLYVSGDGPLGTLPLHAVPGPSGAVVAAHHAVVRVHGAGSVLQAAERHAASGRSDAVTGTRSRSGKPTVFCAGVAAREDPVPARLEGDAALLAEAGWQVAGPSGEAADRTAVLAGLRTASIAHLTCHGYADRQEPLDSGLLLAYGGRRPSKLPAALSVRTRLEHLLTARDFARDRLEVDLLTLRACGTGNDEFAGGDLESLVQALLHAGVGTVVAALWNVDERSSRRLLAAFFRNLADRPAEPLWRSFWDAQRTMLEHPARPWESHPYHWAALAISGDWRMR
ncbi:CHAT domain-containing protein [Streptomyces javensis]|uniref:CHAT domain-containing protein n=1 Tax=Streptomyces javensis TaxID=114698 RepID=UPI0031F978AF